MVGGGHDSGREEAYSLGGIIGLRLGSEDTFQNVRSIGSVFTNKPRFVFVAGQLFLFAHMILGPLAVIIVGGVLFSFVDCFCCYHVSYLWVFHLVFMLPLGFVHIDDFRNLCIAHLPDVLGIRCDISCLSSGLHDFISYT